MSHGAPAVGELLPRAAEASGVRYKLETYSLDVTHKDGGPKARGFLMILGITLRDIDYLEAEITAGILRTPVASIREKPPYGTHCVVELLIRGIGAHSQRVVNVRTVWQLVDDETPPRLVNAYPKP